MIYTTQIFLIYMLSGSSWAFNLLLTGVSRNESSSQTGQALDSDDIELPDDEDDPADDDDWRTESLKVHGISSVGNGTS